MEEVKRIVDVLELRVSIISSTILQIPLIISPYLLKLSSSHPSLRIIWLALYLAIDFLATLCLGIIFHVNMDPNKSSSPQNKYLLAIWAPVILLHLAAHSTVTSYSLADNEFWLSHIIRFAYRVMTALSICILASIERRLDFTSITLLIASTLKFGERVWALKRGSMDGLRRSTFKESDTGLSIREIMHIASSYIAANRHGNLASHFDAPDEQADHLDVSSSNTDEVTFLCAAYQNFNKYKCLYSDCRLYANGEEQGQSFRDMDIPNACNLMEMELSFAYDLFYTKRVFLHSIWCWTFRLAVLLLITSAFGVFYHIDKNEFVDRDVSFTYTLLIMTLILEVVSFLESLMANRTIAQVGFQAGWKWRILEGSILRLRSIITKTRRRIFPRRSISFGQFSLLSFCFKDYYKSKVWVKQVLNFFELKELWDNYWYTCYDSLDDHPELRNQIFNQVRRRVNEEETHNANTFYIAPVSASVKREMPPNRILQANLERDFEECLIVWHLATYLCYRISREAPFHLQNAKCVSDYMLYLLAVQPSMLSKLTTTEMTSYRKACAASIQLYSDYRITNDGVEVYEELEHICLILEVIPREQRVLWNNSLLLDGFELARELRLLEGLVGNNIWELVFKVWVDMLSFSAAHSQGKHHAEQLGNGGEFLTYVWLFMVNLVLDSHYNI